MESPSLTFRLNLPVESATVIIPCAYKPYQVYINSGEYPLFRKVYMISTASNSTVLHSFYTFVTSFAGQKILTKTGILPYKVSARVVELK